MLELIGKHNTCRVFTDHIDDATKGQLLALLDQEWAKDARIRIMPDTHAGKGAVVGTTMTLKDKAVPNLVGVDIGCGMLAVCLKEARIDFDRLDRVIREYVPAGPAIHEEAIAGSNAEDILAPVNVPRAMQSLGTLGGGNHFIEVDRDAQERLWLVIHTGSRHLGIEVCDYYQSLGYEELKEQAAGGSLKQKTKELIESLKAQGRDREISKELAALTAAHKAAVPDVPQALAYVTGKAFDNYLHDMKLAQEHARVNRETIARTIIKRMKLHETDRFDTIHNYIDTEAMILRKGAISAQAGERIIIPMNMRDGSLICRGKGNPDWNFSAPHGAGRILSRTEAKNSISMADFKASMKGIYTTSVDSSTIDESPFAYKPMQEIIDHIQDTAEVLDIIRPVYNFKAGGDA